MTETPEQKCPIWRGSAKVEKSERGLFVDSPRAGGKYEISCDATEKLDSFTDEEKVKLTDWLIDQYKLGIAVPYVKDEILDEVKTRSPRPVMMRVENLLRYLGKSSLDEKYFFKQLSRGFAVEDWADVALAWSSSRKSEELEPLLIAMEQKGFINSKEGIGGGNFSLSVNGYAHLEQLDGPNPDSQQGFVAMWFDAKMDEVYQKAIKPGIEAAGYEPVRVDLVEHNGKIDDEIIAQINRSRFIVADFTGNRGGVYFEAGYAMGMGLNVIWLCRENEIDDVHFDTRQFNHITWSDDKLDLLQKALSNRISAVVGDGPLRSS